MSTHRIAQAAKLNDYVCHALLTELANLPRPLVIKIEFGKTRMHRLWKQSKIETGQIERIDKIEPQFRSKDEHSLILRDKYSGDLRKYVLEIIELVKIGDLS